jgi:hypothetical protein
MLRLMLSNALGAVSHSTPLGKAVPGVVSKWPEKRRPVLETMCLKIVWPMRTGFLTVSIAGV